MNSKQPLPKLTEEQWAQQDLFIDGLVHFLDAAGRIQDTIARREKLQFIHLAFLRRANIRGYVSYDRITADMRTERYVVSRAGALLRKRQLGEVVDLKSDGRFRRFIINKKGRQVINDIDLEIGRQMAIEIRVVDHSSMRYYLFTEALCDLRGLLPYTGVTQADVEAGIDFTERVGPEEMENQKLMTDLAVKPSRSMTLLGKSILGYWNLLMVPQIDPKGWDDRVRGSRKEDVFPPK